MRNSLILILSLVLSAVVSVGQTPAGQPASFKVDIPADAPVSLVTADWGQSRASARGGAVQVDLHSTLQLKNTSPRRLRAITLLVLAQDVTPGGKGSVSVPSLDVDPGEVFPVRLDLRLMRPLQAGTGPLVAVLLDGVLFEDLWFYGPNRLNCRRTMMAWEMEARRDRRHFLARLEAGGPEALRSELLASLQRQSTQPRLDWQLARTGPATAVDAGRDLQFAFLQVPDSPVELLNGSARVAANEARLPRVEMRNRSRKPVRFVEVGWLLKDDAGHEYPAGSLPAELNLAPGQRSEVRKESALRFSAGGGAPVNVAALTGFVSNVEFVDGQVWVPPRPATGSPVVLSPEEQRLAEMYRRRGLDEVIQHLRRLR